MKEPWETLLGQYRGVHWLLAKYLECDVPNIREIQDDPMYMALSHGEHAMVAAAASLLRINECWLAVDDANRTRIEHAVRIAVDA